MPKVRKSTITEAVRRKSKKHSHEITHRVTHVRTKIQDLELYLAETLTQVEQDLDLTLGEENPEAGDTDTVTSCVIKICTTRKAGQSRSESEFDLGGEDEEGEERILHVPPSFYRHPFPEGFRFQSLVPRSREDWLQFLVWLVKQRLIIKYLTDTKLKRVIEIARGQIGRLPPIEEDPDIPPCYYWDEEQVANWVADVGFPELQVAFIENCINGRRLPAIDASALNKMGIQNWKVIQEMARNIRCMFGLPRPNIMRPLSVEQPYEIFLTKYRIHNGRTYDLLTLKEYCKKNSYNYEEVIENQSKNAWMCAIPDGGSHVIDAPSVEFQVRHQFIRSQTIEKLINELIQLIFVPKIQSPSKGDGIPYVDTLIDRILNQALLELGFGDPKLYTQQRVKFAAEIALALLAEMRNTADVMSDISRLKGHLKMEVSDAEINAMREASGAFMEDLAPIAALLALNQLSLEGIFKQEPDFEHFVDDIIKEAESRTNSALPMAELIVDAAVNEAKLRVLAQHDYPYESFDSVREAQETSAEILEELVTKVILTSDPGSGSNQAATQPVQVVEASGDHVILTALVDSTEGAMARVLQDRPLEILRGFILKGQGSNETQKQGVAAVLPSVQQEGTAGEHQSNVPRYEALELFKKLETATTAGRDFGTKISGGTQGQGSQLSRPQSAPALCQKFPIPMVVKTDQRKKLSTKKETKVDLRTTKAKDIWKEVNVLHTISTKMPQLSINTNLKKCNSIH